MKRATHKDPSRLRNTSSMRSPAFQLRPANSARGVRKSAVVRSLTPLTPKRTGVPLMFDKAGDAHPPLLHDASELRRDGLEDLLRLLMVAGEGTGSARWPYGIAGSSGFRGSSGGIQQSRVAVALVPVALATAAPQPAPSLVWKRCPSRFTAKAASSHSLVHSSPASNPQTLSWRG